MKNVEKTLAIGVLTLLAIWLFIAPMSMPEATGRVNEYSLEPITQQDTVIFYKDDLVQEYNLKRAINKLNNNGYNVIVLD